MRSASEELRAEGYNAGVEEKAKDMALRMIKDNEPDYKITHYTGLTAEQVRELRERSIATA